MEVDKFSSDAPFHVTFDCTSSLRTLLEALAAIFSRGVEFKLVRCSDNANEAYLKVEAIDSSQVCIVRASLRCRIIRLDGEPSFTVDAGVLSTCLKSVLAHYSLDLFTTAGSSNLTMRLYETIARTHVVNFDVATMVTSGVQLPSLNQMEYNYILEFDPTTLRNCIRSCRETHAQDIEFSIRMPKAQHAATTKSMTVTISAEGTSVKQQRVFHSIIDAQRGGQSTVIVTDHDQELAHGDHADDRMEEVYNGAFSINYLVLFLKSTAIERHHLTARLDKNQPLVFSYPLGSDSDDSYIVMILAPKLDGMS